MRTNAAGSAPSPAEDAAEDWLFSLSGSAGAATGESISGQAAADAAAPLRLRAEQRQSLPAFQLLLCRGSICQRP